MLSKHLTFINTRNALATFMANNTEAQRSELFDDANQSHSIKLPTLAIRLLLDILSELSECNAEKVIPVQAEVTTQEAAGLLNVSCRHIVKLLETGLLPFHKAGTHRRIFFTDLMKY